MDEQVGRSMGTACDANASAGARGRAAGVGGRDTLHIGSGALSGPNSSSEVGVGTK
jgi:hypothetical protein